MVALKQRTTAALGSTVLAAAIMAFPLSAQTAPSLEGDNLVLSRTRPGLDPPGFDIAGLVVHPELDGGLSYDDNIYLAKHDKVSSAIYSLTPSVTAASDWTRDALNLSASGVIERYTARHSEDYETYDIDASGRIDLLEPIHLDGEAHYRRSIEPRGSAGDLFSGGEPIHFYDRGGSGGITVSLAKLQLTVSGDFSRITYADAEIDGAIVSQAYRDRNYRAGTANISYLLSPALQPFVQISRENEHYDLRDKETSLDSTGTVVLGGVNISLTKLLTGRAGLGYRWRDYRNPNYANSDGLTYDIALVWNPRTLVSVTLEAQKIIEESPELTSSGIVDNQASAKVDYELLRRLIVSTAVAVNVERYRGIDRTDHRISSSLALRYLVNRFVRLDLNYDHEFQHGGGFFGRSYNGNTVGLGVTIQR